ncbi:protein MTSS 1-like isoform X7 [Pangasianodon hypophthalmus]|uniref:protein MTSS 1-like isoform X7 n=1 Tax=Pangasianodon hypophthalmus TaxID=310915 RepID=UPI002307247B|nr:protein MTSS 1-like isoform X7 [Pangasianodon hypophthalmus]
MEAVMEKECSALGGLFQAIINDMKSSYPVWDDFISKAGKLQSQLRTTVMAVGAFLDAFQKVADLATGTRGGTRDIGSALTRMCMRHRSIEAKLKQFSTTFIDCLINPLQEQLEEWKRGANTLDKDHAKEYKKARQEIKKKSSDTLKLQKKAKKGRGDIQPQLDSAVQDVTDKYLLLEETEKQAVRKALIEERARFCIFVSMLRPVVDEEMAMLGEIVHLQTIAEDLKALTMDPHKLPPASEQIIHDLKGSDYSWSYQTPPSSPSTTMSRKSSMCSSLNSVNSSDSRSSGSLSHSSSPLYRYRSITVPQQVPARLASVSSHDSGFASHDAFQSKSPSPMPSDPTSQLPSSSASSESSESAQSLSECSSPTEKDWAKPGPYDQPMVNTLRKKKEPKEAVDANGSYQPTLNSTQPEDNQKTRSIADTPQEVEVQQDLALALSRGLQLDAQRSSRDSLQCSSGYSTQSTTPCCSEDTIPSQVSDYDYFSEQQDFDKSSTVPRNSDLGQSYRKLFQTKRPASTAGIPSVPAVPGVATIRRTPSTKPSVRRGTGPVPIQTPVIPVMTPSVPDFTGAEPNEEVEPSDDAEPESVLPVESWSGQASTNPPLHAAYEGHEGAVEEGDTMLQSIRRGVRLKKTTTNDRSAPRIP